MVSLDEFWQRFVAATGIDGSYQAWGFGDEAKPELMTELGLQVRDGPKRATTGVLAEYEADGDPLPEPGNLTVILGGNGEPLCVIQTTKAEIRRFADVDEEFAWIEGEGDRTLETWRRDHLWYFGTTPYPLEDDTLLVLEYFDLVWDGRDPA